MLWPCFGEMPESCEPWSELRKWGVIQGIVKGTTLGGIKGDTRSLDSGSCRRKCAVQGLGYRIKIQTQTLSPKNREPFFDLPRYSTPVDIWSVGCIFAGAGHGVRAAGFELGYSQITWVLQSTKILIVWAPKRDPQLLLIFWL